MNTMRVCKVNTGTIDAYMNQTLENARFPSAKGVEIAARSVASVVPPTPLVTFDHDGVTIFAKAESLQPMGAFKLRGAWHRLSSLSPEERTRGVVAFSSGNHAQGIAWAARRLGIEAVIVMPDDAPATKIAGTQALGGEVILCDRAFGVREAIARTVALERGATLVPAFDDAWVIEGQGSVGIEATQQLAARGLAAPDLIVACCGGGGLSSGLALACPDAEIVTAEPEHWDDMARSLANGAIVQVAADAPPTACDALMTRRVADLTFGILSGRGARGVAITEGEIESAMRFAFNHLRLVLEPGGAVALAAILSGKVTPKTRTLITLSGGNVEATQFARVIGS
jgi:threonine dehydratase